MVDPDDANWIKKLQARFHEKRRVKTCEFESKIQEHVTWFAQRRQEAIEYVILPI